MGDPNVEKILEGQAEDIQVVAEQINAIQRAQYNCHRHCSSGMDMNGSRRLEQSLILQVLHTRTQGIMRAPLLWRRTF
jgi:hypothetical protein